MSGYQLIALLFAGWVLWEGGRRYGQEQVYRKWSDVVNKQQREGRSPKPPEPSRDES